MVGRGTATPSLVPVHKPHPPQWIGGKSRPALRRTPAVAGLGGATLSLPSRTQIEAYEAVRWPQGKIEGGKG